MARIAEPEKIENIKKAVMKALVHYGYGRMSISMISKMAGVSEGYLYRYYKGKKELVEELIDLEFQSFVDSVANDLKHSQKVADVAYKTIKKLFMRANEDPIFARFTEVVMMDHKLPMKARRDNYRLPLQLASRFIELGVKTGEIKETITPVELFSIAFTIPFRYLGVCLELDPKKKFTEQEVKRITEICMQASQ